MTYTSVLYMRAVPGRRDELIAAFRRLGVLDAASHQAGFVESTMHVALDHRDEPMVTATWTTRDAYAGWLANPVRDRLADGYRELIARDGPPGRVFETVHQARPRRVGR